MIASKGLPEQRTTRRKRELVASRLRWFRETGASKFAFGPLHAKVDCLTAFGLIDRRTVLLVGLDLVALHMRRSQIFEGTSVLQGSNESQHRDDAGLHHTQIVAYRVASDDGADTAGADDGEGCPCNHRGISCIEDSGTGSNHREGRTAIRPGVCVVLAGCPCRLGRINAGRNPWPFRCADRSFGCGQPELFACRADAGSRGDGGSPESE